MVLMHAQLKAVGVALLAGSLFVAPLVVASSDARDAPEADADAPLLQSPVCATVDQRPPRAALEARTGFSGRTGHPSSASSS